MKSNNKNKKKIFEKESEKIIDILNQHFGAGKRYDLSSKIYREDLFDDICFVKKNMGDSKDLRVLDLGCGKGHLSALFSVLLEQKIEAVDLVDSFGEGGIYNVESLGSKWQQAVWDHFSREFPVNYSFYNGEKLPYQEQMFDVLIAYAVLEHVEDEAAFLKECHRVLKPGGKLFIFRCPSKLSLVENLAKAIKLPAHDRLYTKQRLKKLFLEHSFKPIKIGRYDLVPAFFPIERYQVVWNKLFVPLNFFRILIGALSLNFFAHHFRAFIVKK